MIKNKVQVQKTRIIWADSQEDSKKQNQRGGTRWWRGAVDAAEGEDAPKVKTGGAARTEVERSAIWWVMVCTCCMTTSS